MRRNKMIGALLYLSKPGETTKHSLKEKKKTRKMPLRLAQASCWSWKNNWRVFGRGSAMICTGDRNWASASVLGVTRTYFVGHWCSLTIDGGLGVRGGDPGLPLGHTRPTRTKSGGLDWKLPRTEWGSGRYIDTRGQFLETVISLSLWTSRRNAC